MVTKLRGSSLLRLSDSQPARSPLQKFRRGEGQYKMGIRKLRMCRTYKPNSIRRRLLWTVIKILLIPEPLSTLLAHYWSVHNHLQGFND